MTAEEFLAWDEHETIKREFVRGEVFAMAGADEPHVTASMNVAMSLRQHLPGLHARHEAARRRCRRLHPDVFVTCSAADATSPKIKSEPLLVVEVRPPGTAAPRPTTATTSSPPTAPCPRCRNTCWSIPIAGAAISSARALTACGYCTPSNAERRCSWTACSSRCRPNACGKTWTRLRSATPRLA
jgi:hypothetical protein